MVGELLKELVAFTGRVKARSSVNVNDEVTKAGAIALATKYFNSFRPVLLETLGDTYDMANLDAGWQELVRLAHGNNARSTYLRVLRRLASELKEANVGALSRASEGRGAGSSPSDLNAAEVQLLGTLEALLPTAAASYRQGLLDLGAEQRLSYRGTASEFREALRETLDHLAPDADVTKQTGFKTEDGQTRPTMKQKTRFVLTSRGRSKTQTAVTEKAIAVIEGLTGEVVRATYDRASLATHLETTRAEVQRIKRYVDTVLFDLLEIPEAARAKPPRR
jgi:hypothetical protein